METARGTGESPSIAELAGAIWVASVVALGVLVVAFATARAFLRHTESLEAAEWVAAFAIGVPIGLTVARRLLESPVLRGALAPAMPPTLFLVGAVLCVAHRFDSAHVGALSRWGFSIFAVLFGVVVAVLFRRALLTGLPRFALAHWQRVALAAVGGTLGILAYAPPAARTFGSVLASLAILAGVLLAIAGFTRLPANRRLRIVAAIVVPVVIALVVWDLSYRPNPYDFDFFLGPANDLRHGRYLLVDTYSQYGVGVIYFIAAALHFLSFGYGSLMLLLGMLTAVGTLAIYVVLRTATGSILLAGAGAFVAALSGPIGTELRVNQYPSVGFLRFGITWLMVVALVLAYRKAQTARTPMVAACVLVGISAIWSFEAAFYSIGTFVAVVAAVAWARGDIRSALRPLAAGAAAVVVAIVVLVAGTAVGRGAMPHPGGYVDFIRLYSAGGFGTAPVPDWSLGYVICATYVVSFIAIGAIIVHARGSQLAEPPTIVPLVATTAFGVLSFTYFVGRSVPNNLTHISPPFVAMVTLWTALAGRAWARNRQAIAMSVVVVSLWSGALLTTQEWSAFTAKAADSALAAILSPLDGKPGARRDLRVLRSNPAVNLRSLVVENLVRGTEPPRTPLLVLVDPVIATEVLIHLDESNALPISAPIQDGLVPRRRNAIIALAAHVPCGTRVVTQTAPMPPELGEQLLDGVLAELHQHYTFEPMASAAGYSVAVLRCPTR